MPLIELEPPSTLPRGQNTLRPLAPASGSVSKHQLTDGAAKVLPKPSGIGIQRLVSSPPASSKITRVPGSSESRAATVQPAEPAPTTMKSASMVSCPAAICLLPACREDEGGSPPRRPASGGRRHAHHRRFADRQVNQGRERRQRRVGVPH